MKQHTPEQYRALLDRTFAEIRAKREEGRQPINRPLEVGQQRQLWTGPEDELDQHLAALPAGYCYVSTITRHQVTLWVKREA